MNIKCAPHAMPPSDTALPPHFILLTPDGGGDTVIKKMGSGVARATLSYKIKQ